MYASPPAKAVKVAEREQACDEAVLAQGADAEGYADSILAVCRYRRILPHQSLARARRPASVQGVANLAARRLLPKVTRW
jgi:beta-lactamase regulating signal transducer with metallopeptidase domain